MTEAAALLASGAVLGGLAGLAVMRAIPMLALARGLKRPPGLWLGPVLAALFGALALYRFGNDLHGAALCVGGAVLIGIAQFDLAHYRIPNQLVLVLALVGMVDAILEGRPESALLAAAAGAALPWAIATLYGLLRRRTVLGRGDIKLLAAGGLWLGPLGLGLALLVAALITLPLALLVRQGGDAPFGPGLAIGIGALVLLGAPVM